MWWRKELQAELDYRSRELRRRGTKYFSDVEKFEWWTWLLKMSNKMFGESISRMDTKRGHEMLRHIVEKQVPLCELVHDSESSKCLYEINENFAGPGMRLNLDFDQCFMISRSSEFPENVLRVFRIVPLAFTTHVLIPAMEHSLGLTKKTNSKLKPYKFIQNPNML